MKNQVFLDRRISELCKKPELWQRSSEPFWADEHISKGMLEAHLNPDWDAASRKQTTIEASVKWLASVIPSGSSILDLGCGPGLYTKRLSNLGYQVTGMDLSERSIRYAKEHDEKTQYILKSYLEMDIRDAFDAVTLIYADYAALIPAERELLLSRIYQALKPGGIFIFDVFTDVYFQEKREGTSWSYQENGGFWNAGAHLCLEATYFYEDNTVAVDQCVVITETEAKEYLIWDTAFNKERLEAEVLPAGYRLKAVFDDVCGAPYTGKSPTLCFVMEKANK